MAHGVGETRNRVYNSYMQTENGGESVDASQQDDSNKAHDQHPIPASGWKFQPDEAPTESNSSEPTLHHETESVSWTASEYVAHHKTLVWFAALGLVISGLTLGVYLLTKEIVSAAVIIIIGVSFGIFGARQPRVLQYAVDEKGLKVGGKLYPYTEIKSFSVLEEGPIRSILLMPMQRFVPPLSIYYDQADEDRILNVIGNYIPHEEHEHDFVDRLMSKIRF